jgi:hypothetical protein
MANHADMAPPCAEWGTARCSTRQRMQREVIPSLPEHMAQGVSISAHPPKRSTKFGLDHEQSLIDGAVICAHVFVPDDVALLSNGLGLVTRIPNGIDHAFATGEPGFNLMSTPHGIQAA